MNLSKSDIPHVKWSLLIFLSVLGAGGSVIVLSNNFVAQAQRAQQVAQRLLNTSRKQLAVASEDRNNIVSYQSEYGKLVKRHIIGDGQRLDWVEKLENIRKQHLVLDFKYTIAPQHPYAPLTSLDSGNFQLNISDMTLQFDLLHEEQLMNFFNSLRTDMNGRFILESCALQRNPDSGATAQLTAECKGGWLSLNNRSVK